MSKLVPDLSRAVVSASSDGIIKVASTAEIFNGIRMVFAEAELLLALEHEASLRWHNGLESPDHTQWRELFRSFTHVKSLYVSGSLVEELSRSLRPEYGESFSELLPELKTVSANRSNQRNHSSASTGI
jgi:hypothetical protein